MIAFPKTKSATDPLTGAPASVRGDQLSEVHIALTPEAEAAQAQRDENVRDEITNDV